MNADMEPSRRVVIYVVVALVLGYTTFLVMLGFGQSQCGDLESDCDLIAMGAVVSAVIIVVAVMPVIVLFGEIWVRARKRS